MGLLSWLFPSDEDKLARAKADLEKGRYSEARLTALELEGPEAKEIVDFAEAALCRINLEHAVSWAEADDVERVQIHLDLAQEFRKEGMDEDFARARASIRGVETRRQEASARRKAAEDAVLAEVSSSFQEEHGEDLIPLPEGVSADEAEALKARLAMILDNYPEELRANMVELGPDFAQAVLDLDDGDAAKALPLLLGLPDESPLVLHERARAAHSLGDPAAAARAWKAFAVRAGGHHPIGQLHTAVLLAQVQAESGDLQGSLSTLEEGRKSDPYLGGGLYASILEAVGRYGEAEAAWRALLQKFGTQPAIYVGIARVRAKGGHRSEARDALETSLRQTECVPGRCGYRPPDLATHRLLATLYLEDGLQPERALELAETARGLVERPNWDDMYLAALAARVQGDPTWPAMADQLRQATPDNEVRRALVDKHLVA